MAEFNLIDEPWIPCIDRQGGRVEYGIRDTLLKAHELREIYDDSPLVSVALLRLLLAYLYRALAGPRDYAAWKRAYEVGCFDAQTIEDYSDQWKPHFDLFDAVRPFYQMGKLETKSPVTVNRLATAAASGNNAVLFNHSNDSTRAEWSFAETARQLVACQTFALGFGKSGNALINDKREEIPYSADAIALRGMNIWLNGDNLYETLMINLVPIADSTSPPWELDDPHRDRDRLRGKKRTTATARGVVDRLTWQSRLVRLLPEGRRISTMYFTQGRSADKLGDPMKVYRRSPKEGVIPLSLSHSKSAWRDAHSILSIPGGTVNVQRPECLNLAGRARTAGVFAATHTLRVQIVGLASAPSKAGKFLLWRHERMPVPAALLNSNSMIERLGLLLEHAEQGGRELEKRTKEIAKRYLAPDGIGKPDSKAVNSLVETIDPRPAYWARLEEHFYMLINGLPGDWDSDQSDWKKPDDRQAATSNWRIRVKHEASKALEESIRLLGTTARALRAVACVRTSFHDSDFEAAGQSARAGKKGKQK